MQEKQKSCTAWEKKTRLSICLPTVELTIYITMVLVNVTIPVSTMSVFFFFMLSVYLNEENAENCIYLKRKDWFSWNQEWNRECIFHILHHLNVEILNSQNLNIKSFIKKGEKSNCMEMTEKLLICLVS